MDSNTKITCIRWASHPPRFWIEKTVNGLHHTVDPGLNVQWTQCIYRFRMCNGGCSRRLNSISWSSNIMQLYYRPTVRQLPKGLLRPTHAHTSVFGKRIRFVLAYPGDRDPPPERVDDDVVLVQGRRCRSVQRPMAP